MSREDVGNLDAACCCDVDSNYANSISNGASAGAISANSTVL